MRLAKQKPAPISETVRTSDGFDPDLEEIAAWHRWFCDGHRSRLAACLAAGEVTAEGHDLELEQCLKIGDAVTERRRSDLLERRRAAQEATRV